MSDDDTWYELRPGGSTTEPAEHYATRPAAEQAASALLIRRPDVLYVEIVECDGRAIEPTVVGRISPAQPPAPDAAEIDDLHKLPRGAPEQ